MVIFRWGLAVWVAHSCPKFEGMNGAPGVEFVVAFAAVVLEGFEEELGVGGDLEEAASVVGLGGDEEGAVACCSGGDSHRLPSLPQGLKPGYGWVVLWHG
jgi:hypothetical protein